MSLRNGTNLKDVVSMKVAVNNSKAKSTERHNDRSMYKGKFSNEFEKPNHEKNKHWDCMKHGDSFVAEKMFYEKRFRGVLDEQNKRARENYKPELTMDEWHVKHMPQEMIVQLGSLDEPPRDNQFVIKVSNRILAKMRALGLEPISADIHLDEATPHVHIRYVGVDSKGMVNMAGCLREHGVKTPLELACEAAGIDYTPDVCNDEANVKQLVAARPELFSINQSTGKSKLKVRSNTALNVWTNDIVRVEAEELAESLGYEVDTVRAKRRHLGVAEYKTERDRQREEHRLDDMRAQEEELQASVKAEQERHDELQSFNHDFLGRKKRRKLRGIIAREDELKEQIKAFNEAKAQHEQEHAKREEQLQEREQALNASQRAQEAQEGRLRQREAQLDAEVKKRVTEALRGINEQRAKEKALIAKELGKARTEQLYESVNRAMSEPTQKGPDRDLDSPSFPWK